MWVSRHFDMRTVIGAGSGDMNVSFGDILYYKLSERSIHGTLPDYEVHQAEALGVALKLIKKSKK